MKLDFSAKNMHELKMRLRNKYPQLTDKDLTFSKGEVNDMLSIVAYKLRKTKQEMRNIIDCL